jgi:hypothetical protein
MLSMSRLGNHPLLENGDLQEGKTVMVIVVVDDDDDV